MIDLLWFFVPAMFANASGTIGAKLPVLGKYNAPMDFGKKFRGSRIFGEHKTWRGLILGTFISSIVSLLQYAIYNPFSFDSETSLFLGAALGAGALMGDAIESFFKRQLGKVPGSRWFPFDQIDFTIGAIFFSLPFKLFSLEHYLLLILILMCAHLISNLVAFKLGIKDTPH